MQQHLLPWTRPTNRSPVSGTLTDLTRTKAELIAENALLRQQLIILCRQIKRPTCTGTERIRLVLLARLVRHWKQTPFIVQPDTLLGWHRHLFRWFWRQRSKAASRKPKIPAETMALIQTMALNNRLWGAERIRGELLILHEQQLCRVLQAYVSYFNRARPHQGLRQQIPDPPTSALLDEAKDGPILAVPVLGGLHHEYCRVA
jgi:hypothetical protein